MRDLIIGISMLSVFLGLNYCQHPKVYEMSEYCRAQCDCIENCQCDEVDCKSIHAEMEAHGIHNYSDVFDAKTVKLINQQCE